MVGYFGIAKGEIIFASPKIHNAIINDLEPCIADINELFEMSGYNFTARVIGHGSIAILRLSNTKVKRLLVVKLIFFAFIFHFISQVGVCIAVHRFCCKKITR